MRRGDTSDDRPRLRAAQYLRMSTEHQRYSTKNQAAAIARYARRRNYDVVKTYSDDGISGLRFKNREGLKSLLADAVSGEAGFDLILVYDVSRWGRFQNPDQAAHYEFLCAEAGVRVEYCAEIFENDGSLASIMLKNLKRGMAAEFSRDLSVKVAAGKTRLAAKGYWQSGPPGLGLRRTVVDERGHPVVELKPGERKAVQAHRVILTPGPADEIALVNRIYRLFAVQGLTRRAIVRLLNAEGRPTDRGRAWTQATLDSLLSNPKYTGDLRYNRINCRLGVTTRLPRKAWRLKTGAFTPIVPRELFDAAQAILAEKRKRWSDEEMLAALRQVLADRGTLSQYVLAETPGVPGATAYCKRFGALDAAYRLIGFEYRKPRQRCGHLSDAELLQGLADLMDRRGYLSVKMVDAEPGLPCSGTYDRRFGSAQVAFTLVGHVRMLAKDRESPVGRARLAAARAIRSATFARLSPLGAAKTYRPSEGIEPGPDQPSLD